jgi:outer membrane immunogenic protein
MPAKAPVAIPLFSWTGFYVGGNLGGVWLDSSMTETTSGIAILSVPSNTIEQTGLIGGVQAGYNLQYSGLVLGIETDIGFVSADERESLGGPFHRSDLSALATVRGRVGAAFDRLLVFATGGAAFARLTHEVVHPVFGPARRSGWTSGWTIGGGLEYALSNHWTVKAEYLYVDLGDETARTAGPTAYTFAFEDSASIARAGINYKF